MGRKRIYENAQEQRKTYDRKRREPRADYLARVMKPKRTESDKMQAWYDKPFIAIDGEGEDDANGIHHYTMLTASNGAQHHVIQSASLSTVQCFDFLLKLRMLYPSGIFCGFSFNYDINMMLRDIDEKTLTKIWKEGGAIWGKYYISWMPGKIFRVSEYARGNKKPINTITIYDTFSFFQKSFVRTLDDWKIGTAEQVHTILQMKKQRGIFNEVDNKTILEYNTLECVLLVELMNKLRKALGECELYLTSWHGAGAVGGALLKKHGVDEHIAPLSSEVKDAVMRAYFGGRFQTLMLGEFDTAHSHDIRSAYPSSLLNLPSMKDGEWIETNTYDDNEVYSVWHVEWNVPRDKQTIAPFPHRYKRKIAYPNKGKGWYWYPEVAAAKRVYGEQITVLSGYVFKPNNPTKPFSFLTEAYRQRNEFKKAGNDAQLVLKLGINSVYGKTAQGTIIRKGQTPKPPKFQSYFYAGYCTSLTRARIFEMAMRKPDKVIAFATDGVFATEKLTTDDEDRNELGQWEYGEPFYLFWAQSGVYFAIAKEDGKNRISERAHRKTRGLGKSEVSFAKLRKQWYDIKNRMFASDTVSIRRFIGLQYALHVKHMKDWRKWVKIEKKLQLWPNEFSYGELPLKGKEKKQHKFVRFLMRSHGDNDSEPYVEKTPLDTDIDLEYILNDAQPLYEG